MADAAGAGRGAGADLADACPGADSGNVSQSHSSASGLGEPEDEDAWEASLSATAAAYSAYLLADRSLFSEQVRGAAAPRRRGGRSPSRPVPAAGPAELPGERERTAGLSRLPGGRSEGSPAVPGSGRPAEPVTRPGGGGGGVSCRRRCCRCVESLALNVGGRWESCGISAKLALVWLVSARRFCLGESAGFSCFHVPLKDFCFADRKPRQESRRSADQSG